MKRVTYLVGHDLSEEGIAFLCGMHGTAIEYVSMEDADFGAQAANLRNNAGRPKDQRVDIWKPYILVEARLK